MVKIDGDVYNVGVVSLKRKADFLDSEATKRLENGDMYRDLIGVYFNYDLQLEPQNAKNYNEYNRLWEKLSERAEFHAVTVPYGDGEYSFVRYFASVADELMVKSGDKNYWKGLTVNFKAKQPARR
jgi:hypothetical protein